MFKKANSPRRHCSTNRKWNVNRINNNLMNTYISNLSGKSGVQDALRPHASTLMFVRDTGGRSTPSFVIFSLNPTLGHSTTFRLLRGEVHRSRESVHVRQHATTSNGIRQLSHSMDRNMVETRIRGNLG